VDTVIGWLLLYQQNKKYYYDEHPKLCIYVYFIVSFCPFCIAKKMMFDQPIDDWDAFLRLAINLMV